MELDLSTTAGQFEVDKLFAEHNPVIVHAGPPCGTASRARERPIPASLLEQGAPFPRPLRTDAWPRGIPSLSGTDRDKVTAANCIYDFVLENFIERHANNKYFSLENPMTSLFWLLPEAVRLRGMDNVFDVCFSQCLHGGLRPVRRRWLTNIPQLIGLIGECPGISEVHIHSPFRISKGTTGWKFDTAEEATYPEILCNKYVKFVLPLFQSRQSSALAKQVKRSTSSQLSEEEHTSKKQFLRSSLGLFIRGNKYPQLIPEFLEKKLLPLDADKGSTVPCGNHHYGKILTARGGDSGNFAKVGVFRTPAEFIEEAKECRHPIDLDSFLPEALASNIFYLLTTPASEVARHRLEKIRLIRSWASELSAANDVVHKKLKPEQQQVAKGKQFLLLQRILEHIGYPDKDIVKDLIQGTQLTGSVPKSNLFPRRHKVALSSADAVLQASNLIRDSVIARISPSDDPEVDRAVYAETCAEEETGWVSKPITLQDLEHMFENKFVIAKRFGIRQGGKIRCIDDYSISSANSTVESHEKLDLYGCDELFAVLKVIISSVHENGQVEVKLASGKTLTGWIPKGTSVESARDWKGKTFDLKSAYRQIPLAQTMLNKRFSVIALWNPVSARAEFRIQYATPFGAITSVYLFNRAARAVWAAGCFVHVVWTNFFDDYPCLEPAATSDTADLAIRSLCTLLGWTLALEKGKPFEYKFAMLGIITDLTELRAGVAKADNKPERLQELASTITSILKAGMCPKPLLAELRGRAQYAASQISGRLAVGTLNGLSEHQYHQASDILSPATIDAMKQLLFIVTRAKPRCLKCHGSALPILVFTDGAAEEFSTTMGAVVIDTANTFPPYMWGGHIAAAFVDSWKMEVSKNPESKKFQQQIIGQAELLPVALVKWADAARFRHRRVLFFVDNDSARHALIKGYSPSRSSNCILQFINRIELDVQTWGWYSRVPSKSNPADAPSRGVMIPGPENAFAKEIDMPKFDPALILKNQMFSLDELD